VYFLRGSLPWQSLRAPNWQAKYERVLAQKRQIRTEELCRDLSPEFATYMDYLRLMKDPDKPSYAFLRNLCMASSDAWVSNMIIF
jgi:hypothetical protein